MDQRTLGSLWTQFHDDPSVAPVLIDALIDAGQEEAAESIRRGDYDKVIICAINENGDVVYWRGHWVFSRSLATVFRRGHVEPIWQWLHTLPDYIDFQLIDWEDA